MWVRNLFIGLEDILQGTQIVFYTGTLIVVILTYSNARKTLLSPAHTEYHKNVITRLKELSEKLDSEFDPTSPYYWAYVHPNAMKDPVDLINQQFRKNKEAIFVTGEPNRGPYRSSARYDNTKHFARSVKADPFIPREIRDSIVATLNARATAIYEAEIYALQQYELALVRGTNLPNFHKDDIDKN